MKAEIFARYIMLFNPSKSGSESLVICSPKQQLFILKIINVENLDYININVKFRGPIACLVDATDRFEQYTGGIYSEYIDPNNFGYDHVISVVGWGVSADGTEYWIGRNSWGTYWGEHGWFKIVLGHPNHNLGIEGACYWGVPKLMNN